MRHKITPMTESKDFYLPVKLSWRSESHFIPALVDSGAAGNFMDQTVVDMLNIPLITLTGSLSVKALDGSALVGRKIMKCIVPH